MENRRAREDSVNSDDPRDLKPVIRMTAAIVTSFSGAAYLGMTIVGGIVPEPDGWRPFRLAAGVAFAITCLWSAALYRQWFLEPRNR